SVRSLKFISSSSLNSTNLFSTSRLTPLRACSYSRFPSFFIAENIGGACICSPSKPFSAVMIASWSIPLVSKCLSGSVSRSYDGVLAPNVTFATYSLSAPINCSIFLVALPVQIINRPLARGSNVPAWPTFNLASPSSERRRFLILFTTSTEDQPKGLSTSIILPSLNSSGPHFSVALSVLTSSSILIPTYILKWRSVLL